MESSEIKKKVFSGVIWKFCERILAQGISFIVSVVLARLLLPSEYGTVAMVMIFITIAEVFMTSGFSTSLIQKKDANETDFSTIFYCNLVISIVLYIILFFVAPIIANFYNTPILISVLRVFALKIPISAYNSVQHAYVSRNMIFKRFFFSTLFGTLLSGFVGIIMAILGFGVWALVAQYLTNTIVDSIILSFTVPWHPQLKFSWNSAKNLMDYGWKVLVADLIGTFFEQLRSLVIGKVYTSSDLAYYNKGKQIPSLVSENISATVMSVLFPAISNVGDDFIKVKQMIRKSIRVMSYIIFPLMIGCLVISKPLIILLYTEKWSSSIPFMQLLCIYSGVILIGNTSIQVIKSIGRSDILLKLEFYKKPVYVILLIIGVRFSVLGIAVTSVIYSFYATVLNGRTLKKLIDYSFIEQLKDIRTSFILSSLMGLVTWSVFVFNFSNLVTIFLQIIVGIIFYVTTSKIFKVEEYIYLENILKEKINFKHMQRAC